MTQLNTPYPSTAYLTGFLRSRGVDAVQEDLALALVLELFSPEGLQAVRECIARAAGATAHARASTPSSQQFDALPRHHRRRRSPSCRAATRRWRTASPAAASCPKGRASPRSTSTSIRRPDGGDPLAWAFGALGTHDRARHLATLYLNDIADVLRDAVDPRFEFVRYAEALAHEPAQLRAAGRRRWRRRRTWSTARCSELTLAGAGAPRARRGAGVGALPRRGLRAPSASRRRSRRTTRRSSPRSAAASSTPSCAS